MSTNCFADVLRALAPPACMHRQSYANSTLTLDQIPVYVMHAPVLAHRRAHMRAQLERLGALDVTWVLCANREDVVALTTEQRACAHPCVQHNQWFGENQTMKNGTLSLALKHKLACHDMLQRRLPAALMLEDDALLPSNLWARLSATPIPGNADLFYLGSYSRNRVQGTLRNHPLVLPGVHRRNTSALIFGALAYVTFAGGARVITAAPVTTAADIAISHDGGECTGDDGRVYTHHPPANQYGPTEWWVWPVPLMGGGTHYHRT